MPRVFLKNIIAEIHSNFGRFLSIMAIVAIGVAFFAGIKASAPDMKHSADIYFDQYRLQDVQVFSTLGLYDKDVEEIRQLSGVEDVQAIFTLDTLTNLKTTQLVVKVVSYDQNTNVNLVRLIDGRMPQNDNECLIEAASATSNMFGAFAIGNTISLHRDDQQVEDCLKYSDYQIVGTCYLPTYLSYQKGASNIGSGSVDTFIVINQSAVTADYYTEIDVTIEGAREADSYGEDYFRIVDPVRERIELLENHSVKDRMAQYQREIDDGKREYRYQIEQAQQKLDEAYEQLEAGRREIEENEAKIKDAERQIAEGEKELEANEKKLAEAKKQLDEGWQQYYDAINSSDELVSLLAEIARLEANQVSLPSLLLMQTSLQNNLNTAEAVKASIEDNIAQTRRQISETESRISQLQAQIAQIDQQLSDPAISEEQKTELQMQKAQLSGELAGQQQLLSTLNEQLASQQQSLQRAEENCAQIRQQLDAVSQQIAQIEQDSQRLEELRAQRDAYLESVPELLAAYNQLTEAQAQYDEGMNQLKAARITLENSKKEVQQGRKALNEAKAQFKKGEQEYQDGLKEFEAQKLEGLQKLEDAQNELDSLQAQWYVLDRNSHYSYRDYEACADRMDGIASVFPVFFFLVAALICTTTMTRMVDEQRTEIGTLKALGYSRLQIAGKYIVYALIASIAGSIIGCISGMIVFPLVIFKAWNTLYNLKDIYYLFPVKLILLASLSMIISTVLVTIATIYQQLNDSPSQLMRPKSGKAGKKVLLERIPFLWRRLSFLHKVTVRNLFRYKKRFLMTVIGIAGCSALILAGFGINDSISDIARAQYEDIYHYDASVTLRKGSPELMGQIRSLEGVEDIYREQQISATVKIGNKDAAVTIHIVDDIETFERFTSLYTEKKHEALSLSDDGVIISQKLANQLKLDVGQQLTFTDSDDKEITVTVSGIYENYVFHHMYVTQKQYDSWNSLAKITEVYQIRNASRQSGFESALGNQIMALENVTGITFYSSLESNFANMISSISIIVVVLVISAAALAAVVLYNLSNVNISERVREIATIKVLGFTDREVNHYVNRESIIMTIIGAGAGLLVGIYLHDLIMNLAEMDEVMFGRTINPISFVIAFFMTVAFSLIINGIMHFHLRNIQMVESLKAVE